MDTRTAQASGLRRLRLLVLSLVPSLLLARGGWCQPTNVSQHPNRDTEPTFIFEKFPADKPLRLVVYGDMRFTDPAVTSGTDPKVRRWLAEAIGREHPDAVLLTGDMPFVGDRKADWEEYRRETASWAADGFPIFPTLGNHELYRDHPRGIANYLDSFPGIERHRYYSALLGSVEIVSLDMNLPVGPHSDQMRWFTAQLEHLPPSVDFLLILYHIPWVADTQSQMLASLPGKDALALRGVLEAHVGRMHAKAVVFNGHIHNYERFERERVEYVVTGGGGAQPYPLFFRGSHDLYRDTGFPVYHYLDVEVAHGELHATMWKVADPEAPESRLKVEAKDDFRIRAKSPRRGGQ